MTPLAVLLVEADPTETRRIEDALARCEPPGAVHAVTTLADALWYLHTVRVDIVLLDLALPGTTCLTALDEILRVRPDLPVVVLTGQDDHDLALQALGQGAQDFLRKAAVTPQVLARVMAYAIERATLLQRKSLALEMERMTRRVTDLLLHEPDLDEATAAALRVVGEQMDVSRVLLFRFSDDRSTLSGVHEWHAGHTVSHLAYVQNLPAVADDWHRQLEAGRPILAEDISVMDPAVRDKIARTGVRALCSVPLQTGGDLYGFVNFHEMRRPRPWRSEEITALQIVAQAYMRAVEQRGVEARLRRLVDERTAALQQQAEELAQLVRTVEAERGRSETLLRNVLPGRIADRLKAGQLVIADSFAEASILFADIVDFTPLAAQLRPERVLALLDELFSLFDRLARQHGVEKIKTIGDAWMGAAGVPVADPRHLEQVLDLALAMRDAARQLHLPGIGGVRLRIGVHTGPVVAGVIGESRLVYDLWGDAVNTAARMESHGVPGGIHVTDDVARRARGFEFRHRGPMAIKGKGTMDTWLLEGRSEARRSRRASGSYEQAQTVS